MKFYIDTKNISITYPSQVSERVDSLGIFSEYENKKFALKEINEIIANLMVMYPYVEGSMNLKVSIMGNGHYHQILNFKNYEYEKQSAKSESTVKYLFPENEIKF